MRKERGAAPITPADLLSEAQYRRVVAEAVGAICDIATQRGTRAQTLARLQILATVLATDALNLQQSVRSGFTKGAVT